MGCTDSAEESKISETRSKTSTNLDIERNGVQSSIWSRPHLQVLHFNDVYNIEER